MTPAISHGARTSTTHPLRTPLTLTPSPMAASACGSVRREWDARTFGPHIALYIHFSPAAAICNIPLPAAPAYYCSPPKKPSRPSYPREPLDKNYCWGPRGSSKTLRAGVGEEPINGEVCSIMSRPRNTFQSVSCHKNLYTHYISIHFRMFKFQFTIYSKNS